MSTQKSDKSQQQAVQTTGHAWDGDIQEFNNPLPRWWLYGFFATVVFAVIYWFLYPAWPVGKDYTKGMWNTITYKVNGEEKTTHWNTRARLVKEMQDGEEAVKQRKHMAKLEAASYDAILADPGMMQFVRAVGKVVFSDNCAGCHGSGGGGKIGAYPNLQDDDWLWGGSAERIHQTIAEGRRGFMPAFRKTFDDQQLSAVAEYVLSLSGQQPLDADRVRQGGALFNGQGGGCYYCHGADGKGLVSQGAANLTDQIWTIADVPGGADMAAKRERVKAVIRNGVQREMPDWSGRLSATEIKLLTVYVLDLGGGGQP